MSTATTSVALQVANNVRGALGSARISQAQMASILKMSRSAFSQRINGHKAFELDELSEIAKVTGTPFSRLVELRLDTGEPA